MPDDKPIKIREHKLKDGSILYHPGDVKREHARKTGEPLEHPGRPDKPDKDKPHG